MTTGEQLLAAVLDRPEDDTVRLAYADWLQECGTDVGDRQAALIRHQIALTPVRHDHRARFRPPGAGPRCPRCALERENVKLCRWADRLLPAPLARHAAWRRGFVHAVVARSDTWAACRDAVLAAHPLERLLVVARIGDDLDALGRSLAGRNIAVLGVNPEQRPVVQVAAGHANLAWWDLNFFDDGPDDEWLVRNWLGRDWQGRLLADRVLNRYPPTGRPLPGPDRPPPAAKPRPQPQPEGV